MDNKIVNIPRRVSGVFSRRVEHTIQFGVVVTYEMDAFLFAVTAHRGGVEIIGKTPPLPSEAVAKFQEVIRRATKQYEHLKSFPVGTKQTPLTEDELKQRPTVDMSTHNDKETVTQP